MYHSKYAGRGVAHIEVRNPWHTESVVVPTPGYLVRVLKIEDEKTRPRKVRFQVPARLLHSFWRCEETQEKLQGLTPFSIDHVREMLLLMRSDGKY